MFTSLGKLVYRKGFAKSGCMEFLWQGFGSRGLQEVASVKSCLKFPLCPTEPMPDSSKMDMPLVKS